MGRSLTDNLILVPVPAGPLKVPVIVCRSIYFEQSISKMGCLMMDFIFVGNYIYIYISNTKAVKKYSARIARNRSYVSEDSLSE